MKKALIALLVAMVTVSFVQAQTVRTWDGTPGNWSDGSKWDNGATAPLDGEATVITGGSVLLDADTADLDSLTMGGGGGTLTFTNWTTSLNATNVTINSGTLTLPSPFTESDMSNRVYVVCSNFTLAAGATIVANSKGFKASLDATTGTPYGPGAPPVSAHYGGGAGYGGAGGPGDSAGATGGPTYGETNAPTGPGSGGGGNSDTGHGGGAVRIEAAGKVTIDGTINADGGHGTTHGGGGSGGGAFISCADFAGAAGGMLTANGGNIAVVSTSHGGAGGGGRIAVAVGVSAADVQKLIDGDPVANLFTSDRHGGYVGSFSVVEGTPQGVPVGPHNHDGSPGTYRIVTTSSGSTFWLLVNGDPGDYDTPTPYGYGINAGINSGTPIVNTVTSPFDDGGGYHRGCIGWAVTNQAGGAVASGSDSTATFNLTANMVLTYKWTNIYQLAVTSANAAHGSINSGTVDGWYTNATTAANITATALGGYVFTRWTGTGVPAGQETENPLTTTMTEPRILVANFAVIGGGTRVWNGTGNWIDGGNWTPNGIPGPLDDAHIRTGAVTLDEPHTALSLTVSNGTTMVFTNWSTTLTASNVVIGGEVTLPPTFMESDMSNRVHFVCTNLNLQNGGIFDLKGVGFKAGTYNYYSKGEGPGGAPESSHYGGGAGHGGKGADGSSAGATGGNVYGVTNAPMGPGSGGGGNSDLGHGGGAARIAAHGTVTIDGTIDASGNNANFGAHGGGGSGGAIFISCATFQGAASAALVADGGHGRYVSAASGGGGAGGGRIAVAIGLNAGDLQDVIDGLPVADLAITASHSTYAGSVSVTNGWSATAGPVTQDRPGDVGTLRFLQVSSGYLMLVQGDPGDKDSPTPRGYGLHVNINNGTWITNAVTSPYDAGSGYGWGCLGWSVTNWAGGAVASASDTQAVFQVTTNVVLTYKWTNLYDLTVASANAAQGSVNSGAVNGWYTNGTTTPNITATPIGAYVFNRWTGTAVPAGQETANPLAAVMTEPRSLVANFALPGGETKTWNGTGNWIESANWNSPGIPGPADDAHIASGTVTLAEPMTVGSLIVSNGTTMVFTNWNAKLTAAGNVTVEGDVTLPPTFEDDEMSNRVHFVCANFTLDSSGTIDANGSGFKGGRGILTTDVGHGPGRGILAPTKTYYGGGGGHGGVGGDGVFPGGAGGIYDSTNAPMLPGSGGGGNCLTGGNGGGAVRIAASGTVTVDGTIDTSGAHSLSHGGGGSGGAVFISCASFQGAAGGALLADGGDSTAYSGTQYGGAGGGGRISVAIKFTEASLAKLINDEPIASLDVAASHANYFGAASVTNGFAVWAYTPKTNTFYTGSAGASGTLLFLTDTGKAGTLIMVR